MLSRHTHNKLTWIDLASPTQEEVRQLMEEFSLTPMVAEELLIPTMRPRVENHRHFIYLILHFPALRHTGSSREQEVDFIVGKDFIITTRYETIDPLHTFSKIFEVHTVLSKEELAEHAGFVLFYMIKEMYVAVEREIEHVRDDLNKIEHDVFRGQEREMVIALSQTGRDLLNLRRAIEPHRDILNSLAEEGVQFFGPEIKQYLVGLTNNYFRVHNHIMRDTESLRELRETNNSLLSTKQNDVTKLFTIMAFITFPLALLVDILKIPSPLNPVLGMPNDFFIIVGIVIVAALLMFAIFDRKGWI